MVSIARLKTGPFFNRFVISLKTMPALGKSGMSRQYLLKSSVLLSGAVGLFLFSAMFTSSVFELSFCMLARRQIKCKSRKTGVIFWLLVIVWLLYLGRWLLFGCFC